MSTYVSPFWNESLGVCTLHYLPEVPCPACIAEQEKHMEIRLSPLEKVLGDNESEQ